MNPSYAIVCTGLGHVFRGYEASTLQLYQQLRSFGDFRLYAGGSDVEHDGEILWNVPRGASVYKMVPAGLATFFRRYQIECFTAARSLVAALYRRPADVIFTPDHLLAAYFLAHGEKLPKKPRVIFSNGAPFPWSYCSRFHYVHQKSYRDYRESLADRTASSRVFLIPNGFDARSLELPADLDMFSLRESLDLPIGKHIILSVAALQVTHKRLDWLIREFSALPASQFHLVLAGARTEETQQVTRLCHQSLPAGNFTITTVAPDRLPKLLWASDIVVLCSLSEGFSRAIGEAMGASRLVLVHPHENSQWVVDNPNCYVDMTQAGDLQRKILEVERGDRDLASDVAQNLERFTRNFEWDAVRAAYLDMFRVAAAG